MTAISSTGWKEVDCFVGDFKRLIKRMGMGRRYVLLLLLRAPFDGARAWMLAALMKSVFRCLEAGGGRGAAGNLRVLWYSMRPAFLL